MVDAFGDRVKGVVEQFHVSVQHGHVSDIEPSADGWTGLFKYTPPPTGDRDVVSVVLTASDEEVVNGTTVFDVADHPSAASVLACQSASWPPTTVLVGDRVNCSIEIRTGSVGSSSAIKGVPADFSVFVSHGEGLQQLAVAQLAMGGGGYTLNFSVTAPRVTSDGVTAVHALDVLVHSMPAAVSIQSGSQQFDVAHQPFATDSLLQCNKVERFDRFVTEPLVPAGVSAFDVIVATYETALCVITGHGTHAANTFPAKTLSSHYHVDTLHGHVSELQPVNGGTQLEFW